MKIKELVIKDDEDITISAISLVNEPAIESDFIALSDAKTKLAVQDEDQRLLIGAALIPNKLIYRDQDGEEFYIYFTKSTIRKSAEGFLNFGRQREVNVEHAVRVNGVSVVESWIVEDPEKDKTALYNLNLPVGSWAVSMRVYDEDLWQSQVKTGAVRGFSIEGTFAQKLSAKTPRKTAKKFISYEPKKNILS